MLKKLMAIAISFMMLFTMIPASAYAETTAFTDMPDDWSTEALESAVSNGLLNGANGKIMPEEDLTRAQMATIINRAFGAEKTASLEAFTDVLPTDWYYVEMAKAVAMMTFQGSGENLNPENPITREESFAVIARAFHLGESTVAPAGFTDLSEISTWATGEVYALVNSGYIQGSNGMLNPQGYITRAEFAQVMHNIIQEYIKESGEHTVDVEGNVMINTAGVILVDSTIDGDLIIGDGVGEGEIILRNVVVTGKILVRSEDSVVTIEDTEEEEEETSTDDDGGSSYTRPRITGAYLNGEEAEISDDTITVEFVDEGIEGQYDIVAEFNKRVKVGSVASAKYPGLDISFINTSIDDDDVPTGYSSSLTFSFDHTITSSHFEVFGDEFLVTVTDGTTDLEFTIVLTGYPTE